MEIVSLRNLTIVVRVWYLRFFNKVEVLLREVNEVGLRNDMGSLRVNTEVLRYRDFNIHVKDDINRSQEETIFQKVVLN